MPTVTINTYLTGSDFALVHHCSTAAAAASTTLPLISNQSGPAVVVHQVSREEVVEEPPAVVPLVRNQPRSAPTINHDADQSSTDKQMLPSSFLAGKKRNSGDIHHDEETISSNKKYIMENKRNLTKGFVLGGLDGITPEFRVEATGKQAIARVKKNAAHQQPQQASLSAVAGRTRNASRTANSESTEDNAEDAAAFVLDGQSDEEDDESL